jgi:exodeoxyribonuclease V alpha subunit
MNHLNEGREDYIKGELLHLIFHNEESLYTVAKVRVNEASQKIDDKEITVVGMMTEPDQEVTYEFKGAMSEHPRFGRQFKFVQFKKVLPETEQGIILYLSSDRFPGIGRKTAQVIVEQLGITCISKILENPAVLDEVPKLAKDKAQHVYKTLLEDQGIEQILLKLYEFGFGVQLAMKVYKAYQTEALDIIQTNPYRMVEDVEGIGFGRADLIGRKQGIIGSHPDRLKAAIHYVLHDESLSAGHVYSKNETIVKEAKWLLEKDTQDDISPLDIANEVIALGEEGKIIVEGDRMFLPSLYFAEQGIVTNLRRLMAFETDLDEFPESEFLKALGQVEEMLGITYASSQKEGIQQALQSPMLILTGGPGTGKTTVIKGLVEVFGILKGVSIDPEDYKRKKEPFPILMAAPTGRAAKRMSESTGLPASTIHRLLGYKGEDSTWFEKGEGEQLEGKMIIVDEMSMVDTWLANQLLKAIPDGMQVILVGDEDQLPSVGPGQVLADLLTSDCIPAVRLTDIYRQSEGSQIIEFSHQIKEGTLPDFIDRSSDDLRFFPCEQSDVPKAVKQICERAIEKGFSAKDIQVLAPMYRGVAGVENLNDMLQTLFNPKSDKKKEVPFGDVVYRSGDMVLQLVNNPEENVFNGDRGEIIAIKTGKEAGEKHTEIIISFDGEEVSYTRPDLTQITHAYCCSIHKSQGSEFPIVIMPVVRGYYRMLRKKLIYTGVTRAKNFLLLCGSWESLQLAVETNTEENRQTTLKEKLADQSLEIEYTNESKGAMKD